MTATSTLAHAAINLPSSLRTSGHATPNYGSRSSTPVRVKRVLHAQTDASVSVAALDTRDADAEGRVRRSSSAHVLDATALPSLSDGRCRRLSVTTYGECGTQSPRSVKQTVINDVLTRRPLGDANVRQPGSLVASSSQSVLELQMPLIDYAVLGPDAMVVQAASQVADPAVRCVVVAIPGAAHILTRQDVERLARYCHDPFADTLGSYLTGTRPTPSVYPGATLGAAAGLLLECGGADFLPVVEDGSGSFLGLLSRADIAQALLGDRTCVYDAAAGCAAASAGAAPHAATTAPAGPLGGGGNAATGRPCRAATHQEHRLPRHHQGTDGGSSGPSSGPLLPLNHQVRMHQATAAAATAAAAVAVAAAAPAAAPSAGTVTGAVGAGAAAAAAASFLAGQDLSPHALLLPPHQHRGSAGGAEPGQQPAPQLPGWRNSQSEQQQHHPNPQSAADGMEHSNPADGLRSVGDPIKSGWDMLDNADDVLDVLGMVGKTVNAEAMGRKLIGDAVGAAANIAGGSSGTGWLFKYLYDGDCSICRTFQAMLEKLDNGAGRVAFIDIAGQGFNPIEHGGINYRAAMETIHILSANGQVFKGVTAVIKLLAAVDTDLAANMATVTTVLPLLSLSYMLVSKNRHALSKVWAHILRTTKVDRALFGRDIMGPAGMGGSDLGGRGGARRDGAGSTQDHKLQPQPSN